LIEQQIVNGLMLGSTYSLTAIGYTLVLGLLDMLNLAHGDVFMIAGFVALSMVLSGVPFWIALPAAMAVGALLSILVERVCFWAVRGSDILVPLLMTLALGMVLQNVATEIWGSEPLRMPSVIPRESYRLGPISLSMLQITVLGISLVLMLLLDLLVQRTYVGRAMRAAAESPSTAGILGVNVPGIIMVTFLISGALAGAGGVLTAMTFSTITPFLGINQGLKAMVAMVIGGVGSMRGAMVAGLLLGIAETLSVAYLGASYREMVVYGLLLFFLWARPGGLFQTQASERV